MEFNAKFTFKLKVFWQYIYIHVTTYLISCRICFFNADAINNKVKFMAQINQSFGSGGMTSGLDNTQLIEFFQHLQRTIAEPLPIKKVVIHTGMQPDGSCIINKNTFVSSDGTLMDCDNSQYTWLDKDLISDGDKIRSVDISPNIVHPLSNEPIRDLINVLEIISKHNFKASMMVVAGVIMAFHYSLIKDIYGGCTITVAMGP